ncbi:MAG: hypothetical protein HY663_05025, partial [Chloroflexi bacterium]|nr:hypothetical protein [Chloroflexota bacterium]
MEKARREGIVTVTSGMGPQVSKPLVEAYKNRFGISVEWITGRAVELSERVLRERRAGIYSYDLYSAGHPIALTSLKPAGAFSPMEPLLLLPEVKDPNNWFQNRLPWADRDKTVFSFWLDANPNITINTNLVKKDEIKSYYDLLDPKWKGKIIMDV